MGKGYKWNWNWDWDYGTPHKGKRKWSKLFWGLFLILMGIFLVISKMGLIKGIGFWSVFFTIIFAALFIRGLVKRNFTAIFFSIAFLCIIYDDQLGITALTPWTVLLAALLLSVGMNILFHKKGSYRKYIKFMDDDVVDMGNADDSGEKIRFGANFTLDDDKDDDGSEEESGGTEANRGSSVYGEKVYQKNRFSTRSKYINPEMFERGMFENSFGSMNIFFENVATQKKEAYLEIDNSFGEMNIYIPSSWAVDVNVDDNFSDTVVRGHGDGSNSFLLHIGGDSSFGEVHIIYQ